MDWLIFEPEHELIIDEIGNQSDRGAALIASSLLEGVLESSIRALLWSDKNTDQDVYAGNGPFATFSAKINVAYMMGLYPSNIQKLCHTLRKIRNEFAHETKPINFESSRINDLCKNLSASKIKRPDANPKAQIGVLDRLVIQLSACRNNRERYIASVILVTGLIASVGAILGTGHVRSPPFSLLYKS